MPPTPADPSKAPSLSDRDTNRQLSEGKTPQAADQPSGTGEPSNTGQERLPNVGDAPTTADDVEDRPDKDFMNGPPTRT